ncbi:lasso peptide biosynthesis B2 protein [Brevundimonas sp. KM4]|uniref:lasso peptide biosynthesis B2 protein n=1 Tax=Brevundimonas sp. KM4 TaxID=1628191 RepID=UPI0009E5AF3C|nr:lasso peptide biosynthesis B2 protein [Brevundimonas sp. KM4]HAL07027.1 lasso peptide biosynthesis B2 protein [Brevundimonas sp.]
MTQLLWCAPGVFMSRVDDDVVILDVESDAYQCLIGGGAEVHFAPQGALRITDPDLATELQLAGLIKPDRPPRLPSSPIAATRELPLPARMSASEVLSTGFSWAIAAVRFQRKSLRQLLAFEQADGLQRYSEEKLSRLVGATRISRTWVPGEGECLQRSFQLRHVLAARGVRADWVFGVRTWPFNAHCWLQIGDLVVGDRLARVRRYTPIMRS